LSRIFWALQKAGGKRERYGCNLPPKNADYGGKQSAGKEYIGLINLIDEKWGEKKRRSALLAPFSFQS